ncbi:hypothetical protein BD410DRAFT_700524, partial [Rickenella mellea]
GLTLFQMVNNLSYLGICSPPEPEEVGDWIHNYGNLGAGCGLRLLGFIPSTDGRRTRAAFCFVYSQLNDSLSPQDKKDLHFDAIFVEHLLCKVKRWNSRYTE